jgi:hypothetical protein
MTTTTSRLSCLLLALLVTSPILPTTFAAETPASTATSNEAAIKADAQLQKKATDWTASLSLNDPAKEARVSALIASHLIAVRDWHNAHPATTVPEGINPLSGQPLSKLDREIIADSAMPKSVNATLLAGLHAELTQEQFEAVLDKYTEGKVAFTLKGYKAIVPDLTAEEEKTITAFLKQARDESIGFKNMKQVSAIFEIYKTKSEQYLNANGRSWKDLYKAYTAAVKAKKAADAAAKKNAPAAAK